MSTTQPKTRTDGKLSRIPCRLLQRLWEAIRDWRRRRRLILLELLGGRPEAYPPPDPETVERARQDAREGRVCTVDDILSDMDAAAETKKGWSP